MRGEHFPNPRALKSRATPVDDSDFPEAFFSGGFHIGTHDVWDVTRLKGVQIDRILDRKHDDIVVCRMVVRHAPSAYGWRRRCDTHQTQATRILIAGGDPVP